MTITEEAVQAAHSAICEENLDDCLEWRGKCVKAVEAAAPLIRADAKAEAWEETAEAIEALRPEMGQGINITQYREGLNDAFVRSADVCTARAAAVRGEG